MSQVLGLGLKGTVLDFKGPVVGLECISDAK